MDTKLILICGKKNSGKSFLADYVKEEYGEKINLINLSDPIKYLVGEIFGLDKEELEGLKKISYSIYKGKTMRNILQNLGETMKEITNDFFWCDIASKKIQSNKINIITDIRLQSEVDYFNNYIIIKIMRNCDTQDFHRTETEQENIKADHIIENNNSTEEFKVKIKEIFDRI